MAGPTFLYIDYGPSPDTATELKYSVATLLAEYVGREPEIVVYTDKPAVYAGLYPRLKTRAFGEDFERWSRRGLYAHRVKPCVLLDALKTFASSCVLLDADTFCRSGFANALEQARAGGVAMDHFERDDPCPDCASVIAELPQAGRYAYAPTARMYNSGLIAADVGHAPALEDAIALIDAWLDAGIRQFNIEQIALSETFRLHGVRIAEMKPWFAHYYRRSQRLYMRRRIEAWFERGGGGQPTRPLFEPSHLRVRFAHIWNRVTGRE